MKKVYRALKDATHGQEQDFLARYKAHTEAKNATNTEDVSSNEGETQTPHQPGDAVEGLEKASEGEGSR